MTTTDIDILRMVRESPEQGFRALMDKYMQPVYWHIRRLLVAHADAQDATQDTFVRVYRSIASLEKGASLAPWIYRIATNEALRVIERRKQGAPTVDIDTTREALPMADDYVDYSDLEAVRLQKAILSLPEKQQVTFCLRYYDDMDYADIAAVTGSTAAAAKANYHVAKEKIKKYMNSND